MKEFTFTLSEANANLMLSALTKMPFEAVVGLITDLQQQAQRQVNTPPTVVESKTDAIETPKEPTE